MTEVNRCLWGSVAFYSFVLPPIVAHGDSLTRELTAGSKVLLTLDEGVTSKRDDAEVGQVVRCRV